MDVLVGCGTSATGVVDVMARARLADDVDGVGVTVASVLLEE